MGVAQGVAEGEHQGGLAGADGSLAVGFSVSACGFLSISSRLGASSVLREGEACCGCGRRRGGSLPTDSYREGSLVPIAPGYYGHLALGVGARAVEYLVRVAVFCGVELVRVAVGMGGEAVVAVGHFYGSHHWVLSVDWQW